MKGNRFLISVVMPVFNEAENIQACLRSLVKALKDIPHEILICYDDDGDTTLPAIAEMDDRPTTIRLVKNDLGLGVAYALRKGFQMAKGDVIVSFMSDLSDSPEGILAIAEKIRHEGAHVVSGSRYMKGGRQVGGPFIKGTLSRLSSLSLCWLTGLGTRDATTNFRGYSAKFLQQVSIESQRGFEVGLELTVKAHMEGWKIAEIPSIWHARKAGKSRFRLIYWLPHYLRWYIKAMAKPRIRKRGAW